MLIAQFLGFALWRGRVQGISPMLDVLRILHALEHPELHDVTFVDGEIHIAQRRRGAPPSESRRGDRLAAQSVPGPARLSSSVETDG